MFYVKDPQDSAWSVMLAAPSVAYTEDIEDDDFSDFFIHHELFSNGMPSIDVSNEIDPPYIRGDCDGIWVNNAI